MPFNVLPLFGAALIPMIVGAIWYNPKVFGTLWMRLTGKTEEDLAGDNMFVILGLSYILGLFLAFAIAGLTNHQMGLMQLFATHPDFQVSGTEVNNLYNTCLLYTSPSPRDRTRSRMPSSA